MLKIMMNEIIFEGRVTDKRFEQVYDEGVTSRKC